MQASNPATPVSFISSDLEGDNNCPIGHSVSLTLDDPAQDGFIPDLFTLNHISRLAIGPLSRLR